MSLFAILLCIEIYVMMRIKCAVSENWDSSMPVFCKFMVYNTVTCNTVGFSISVFWASLVALVLVTRASVVIVRRLRSHYTSDREPGEPCAAANEPFAPCRRAPVPSRLAVPGLRMSHDGGRQEVASAVAVVVHRKKVDFVCGVPHLAVMSSRRLYV